MLMAAEAASDNEKPDVRYVVNAAASTWDFPLALASNLADAKFNSGAGASTNPDGATIADAYGLMHDFTSAARALAMSDPSDPTTKLETLMLQGEAAMERGDPKAAAEPLDAFYKAWLADPNAQYTYANGPCIAGLAFGLSGRKADADAAFKRAGNQSLCYAAHGDVLVQAGDVAGAQRVWAEGLKNVPDLPAVPVHRGVFELSQGDLKSAQADFAFAAYKAPHWAEPRKGLGDVRMREGRWRDALREYDTALKYAPAWNALRQARAEAARRAR
jgi:tetratricopeptide (TPR) repeat protein